MKRNTTKFISLMLAAVLVVSMAGMALAAAPSVDSETTDTATTSELTDTDTITYNDTTKSILGFSADSSNGSVVIFDGDRELVEYTNDSALVEKVGSGTGLSYYNATFADDGSDFDGIRADPGESVDLTLSMVNDSSLSYADADVTNITVTFSNDANTTFESVDSSDTETAEPSIFVRTLNSLPVISDDEEPVDPAQSEREVNITGDSQDEIIVDVADSDAQDALSDSVTDLNGVSYTAYAEVDDSLVPVVSSAADAPEWIDTDTETYVTVADDGGQATVYNAGDLFSQDQQTTTVSVTGAEQLNVLEIQGMISEYDGDRLTQLSESLMGGEFFGAASDQFEA